MKLQPSLMSEVKTLFNFDENSAVAAIFKIWPKNSAENSIIFNVLVVILLFLTYLLAWEQVMSKKHATIVPKSRHYNTQK